MNRLMKFGKENTRKIFVLLAVLACGAFCFSICRTFDASALRDLIAASGEFAPLAYIAAMVVLPAFFFPVVVLALAGGLLFGFMWGSIYTFIGALINCALMFMLSRHAGREHVQTLVRRKLSPIWQNRISAAAGRRGFLVLIALRLIPAVPYNLINYASGLTQMSFGTYMLASAIGIIPGTFVFINLGDKALDTSAPSFWIAGGLLIALLVVTALLGKKCFSQSADISKKEMLVDNEKSS